MIYIIVFFLEILLLFFLSRNLKAKIFGFLFRVIKNEKWVIVFYSILFLPGTFVHEASHFLFSLLLFVPVGQMNLVPKLGSEDGGVELGSIPVAKTDVIRKTLIGIAPLIFGIISTFFLVSYFGKIDYWWLKIIFGYLIFEIANSMFSSKKDLEGSWVLALIIVLFIAILYFLGVRISISSDSFISVTFTEIVKKVNLFLLVPLSINLALILLSEILGKGIKRK